MRNYRSLRVWNESISFSTKVYKLTELISKDEKFGIISQMQRSTVSIPSNIAEGAGRDSDKEFNHFLSISLGSAFELETQLIICKNLNYLTPGLFAEFNIHINDIQKMIFGLKKNIKGTGLRGIVRSIFWLF